MDIIGVLSEDVDRLNKKVDVISVKVSALSDKVLSQGVDIKSLRTSLALKEEQICAPRNLSNFLTIIEIIVGVAILAMVAGGFVFLINVGGR